MWWESGLCSECLPHGVILLYTGGRWWRLACFGYQKIEKEADAQTLQEDLDRLQEWERKSLMEFNPDKCEVLRITQILK